MAPAPPDNTAPPLPDFGIGPRGYKPAPDDENLLARIMFAEGSNTPDDYPALGWATVNRVGAREFGGTLQQVIDKKNGFQNHPRDGDASGGSPQWRRTADPSKLTGKELKALGDEIAVVGLELDRALHAADVVSSDGVFIAPSMARKTVASLSDKESKPSS